MKRGNMFRFSVMAIAMCLSFSLQAQHYVGFSVAGDMPFVLDKLSLTRPVISGGGEAGAVYQYQYKHLLLQTGLQLGLQVPKVAVDDEQLEARMTDTRGVRFVYLGSLRSRQDASVQLGAGVPLMIGYGGQYFYALAGARYYQILTANTTQKAQLRTVGDYEGRYYDLFENMPNHGYHDFQPVESKGRMSYRYDIQVLVEIGGRIRLGGKRMSSRTTDKSILQVGVWASYGVMDIQPKQNVQSLERLSVPDYTEYMQVDMTYVYKSKEGVNASIHALNAGLKATLLFSVGGGSGNNGCHCVP